MLVCLSALHVFIVVLLAALELFSLEIVISELKVSFLPYRNYLKIKTCSVVLVTDSAFAMYGILKSPLSLHMKIFAEIEHSHLCS